ncbi:ADP-heptose synthase [Candidatus Blochmanniella floridana]|uniref:Bifunctional protein HldE n=1 Tax=Blochmanniella floridana TaxID=203907 RepID=HLDE_BLOFL|nr:RecName: Full=Bifunctional protein HldE; Includes: RecName: Full=D-beta-D-heptose 7-phosphate kinase; AltName: Full=D-beta-D-heptose 7-phosphotransferase; AltName: Full=D-glycero-beta-D-manno-heptose-7-phosphate kinase; Includes: RecName: Full=D-beta-D-heptose 1-phosphate adenylyltransferase; AltName: Full=D-glycero-beta-D-manno-heptose 1-phosphate adenylyltransferase [Candidatus Blochmannia floridanus]CAD83588.1 ADP-heptose synthase [Candidatus Blochmannia floridanus]
MTVILPDFLKSNVLVVGDIMLDRYWYGSTNKISFESPVPVVEINNVIDIPGGAANVAMNIASLGGRVRLIGLVGVDDAAQRLKKRLTECKIKWNFISVDTHPTIMKLRVMSRNQQMIRLDFEKKFNNVNTDQLMNVIKVYLPQYKVLALSDYAKGTLDCVEEIIKIARFFKIPIIIDPKGVQFSKYKGATILTPNMSEFEAIVGFCSNEEIIIKRAKELMNEYDLLALLITRSDQGMTLLQRSLDPLYFSAQSKEVYDVTGAGDTVVGVLSAALSLGENLEKSCFLANAAAGSVVEKSGTSTVNVAEINNVVQKYEYTKIPTGIVDRGLLKYVVSVVRGRGEKIVMTNGVFDILHYGHISYLMDAKKLGHRLIVAVNSDKSTRRLKGKHRPINVLERRMFVLSALSMVDWVVSFDEDNPIQLILEISPDFLVKGGDYNVNNIVGGKEVLRQGGQVCVLKFQEDCSSSSIIDTMEINEIN